MEDINDLIKLMIECAKAVRRQLGPGFLEAVYKNAMLIEIRKHNHVVKTEVPFEVRYDGIIVGSYRADMIVDNRLILELKATTWYKVRMPPANASTLTPSLTIANEIQLVNYLNATGIDDGFLINFGSDQLQFKHKYRTYKKNVHNT